VISGRRRCSAGLTQLRDVAQRDAFEQRPHLRQSAVERDGGLLIGDDAVSGRRSPLGVLHLEARSGVLDLDVDVLAGVAPDRDRPQAGQVISFDGYASAWVARPRAVDGLNGDLQFIGNTLIVDGQRAVELVGDEIRAIAH